MDYSKWRENIFGQPVGSDPVLLNLPPEFYKLTAEINLDLIDRALIDPEIHSLFHQDQIGIGLQLIYENCCSNICFCYLQANPEERRVNGIRNIGNLYKNYFDRYCVAPIRRIGNDHLAGRMGYLCYMFWDVFAIYPGNATPNMFESALDVMSNALQMANDNCIVSAIHGLGHSVFHSPRASNILHEWLESPTTQNGHVIDYAHDAMTGCIQ